MSKTPNGLGSVVVRVLLLISILPVSARAEPVSRTTSPIDSLVRLTTYLEKNKIRSVGTFTESLRKNGVPSDLIFVKRSRSLQQSDDENPRVLIGLAPGAESYRLNVAVGSTNDPSGRGETLEGIEVDESSPDRTLRFFTVEFADAIPDEVFPNRRSFRVNTGKDVQTLCNACHRQGFIWNSARFWPSAAHELARDAIDDGAARSYLGSLKSSVLADRTIDASARKRYLPLIDQLLARPASDAPAESRLASFAARHARDRLARALAADGGAVYRKHRPALVGALGDCDLSQFGVPNSGHAATEIADLEASVDAAHRNHLEDDLNASILHGELTVDRLSDRIGSHADFFPADLRQSARIAKFIWVAERFSGLSWKLYSIDFLKTAYELWEEESGAAGLAARIAEDPDLARADCATLSVRSRAALR